MRTLTITLLLALAAFGAQAEEVYRTVQADGTVVYSDRPISADSVRVQVKAQPGQATAPAASSQAGGSQATGNRPANNGQGMAAARAEQARLKAEACAEARKAVEVYERSPKLYEELPDGGRRYLSDEEMIEARQKARQAVADFCEPEPRN